MSSYSRNNFFEVLGAFVPGYKGYRDKEMRRESDRILRDAIVSRLQEKKTVVDDLIRDFAKQAKFDLLEASSGVPRRSMSGVCRVSTGKM